MLKSIFYFYHFLLARIMSIEFLNKQSFKVRRTFQYFVKKGEKQLIGFKASSLGLEVLFYTQTTN